MPKLSNLFTDFSFPEDEIMFILHNSPKHILENVKEQLLSEDLEILSDIVNENKKEYEEKLNNLAVENQILKDKLYEKENIPENIGKPILIFLFLLHNNWELTPLYKLGSPAKSMLSDCSSLFRRVQDTTPIKLEGNFRPSLNPFPLMDIAKDNFDIIDFEMMFSLKVF